MFVRVLLVMFAFIKSLTVLMGRPSAFPCLSMYMVTMAVLCDVVFVYVPSVVFVTMLGMSLNRLMSASFYEAV